MCDKFVNEDFYKPAILLKKIAARKFLCAAID